MKNVQVEHAQLDRRNNLSKIKIIYQPYATHELVKTPQGDWIDMRAYRATKIVPSAIIHDKCASNPPQLERTVKKIPLQPEKGVYEGEEVEFIRYHKGDHMLLDLGVVIQMEPNTEGYVVPRSSTMKNFGLIQTNSKSIIDNSYQGKTDIWFLPVLALRDGFFIIGERVAQFRTAENMKNVELLKVQSTEQSHSRGGIGSSGTK